MKWILIILALLYFISPYDLIPGTHPVSWIDDIVIMVLLFRYLARLRRYDTYRTPPGWDDRDRRQGSPDGAAGGHDASPPSPRSPYEVLNISPTADQAEIKAAYRKMATQYHPDKVAHLGEEFRELAEQRFKEIQEAYDKLVR